jgi:hypothetical protein
VVASVDKAREIGIDWWEGDPALSRRAQELDQENSQLREQLEGMERRLAQLEEGGDG